MTDRPPLKQLIKQRLGLTGASGSRLAHLLLLAVSMMGFSVVALTAASSLFLTRVGAENLPRSYILMGLVSLPAYSWLSRVVDRYSRVRLCQAFLVLGALCCFALRALLALDAAWPYYALHVSCYFQWILVPEVLFPSLVSDYFTALDWKRYAPFLKMAMAVGGLLGGGLTAVLASRIPPENLLFFLPVWYAIAFCQLVTLANRQRPLSAPVAAGEGAISWKTLPALLRDYPIILFLASSTFCFILLYSIAEFTYLGIYAQHFSDSQALTRFLGAIRAANNILPFFILYFVTRTAIARWGVSRSNLLYPFTTCLSFIGLTLNFNLGAAVLSNVNADGLDDSLNQPIHNLNYNAVPYALVGQVRAIANGLVYSLGLALSGLLLGLSQSHLTPRQIAWAGVVLSLVFLGVRYGMGQSYVRSLLALLKSGSVQLEQVGEGFTRVPSQYRAQIRLLLNCEDCLEQNLGLELARRIENPSQFLPEVDLLFQKADARLERSLLNFFKTSGDPELPRYLHRQLASESETVQRIALLALIASKQPLTRDELCILIRSSSAAIQALAYIAFEETHLKDKSSRAIYNPSWLLDLDRATAIVSIQGLRSTGDRKYLPILQTLIAHPVLEVKRHSLETLAMLARPGDRDLALLATTALTDLDPPLRAAALKVLSVARHPTVLPQIAKGLEHSNLAVRLWAAKALAAYGEEGLGFAAQKLQSPRAEVVEAAIAAIGQVRTSRAETLLFEHLKPDCALVLPSLRWQAALPPTEGGRALKIALEDFRDRTVHRLLYILSNLDREGTSSTIRRILHTSDARLKANALETLAAGRYRRFVVPILPLFEPVQKSELSRGALEKSLTEALKASDRWIRLTASFALGQGLPEDGLAEGFPLADFPPTASSQEQFLKRTLFLKTVSLLEPLFLDELLGVNRALYCEHFSAGETLCTAGTPGRGLHIIGRGSVALVNPPEAESFIPRGAGESALSVLPEPGVELSGATCLKPGQFFGEMTLLDDAPLTFTAIARSDCTLLTLPKTHFAALVDRYPRLLMGLSGFGSALSSFLV